LVVILLDTMVVSELRKSQPNPAVVEFLKSQSDAQTFLSVMTVGEIEAGIERQRALNPLFATVLAQWLTLIELQFASRLLPVTPDIAKLWGRLCMKTGNKGTDNLIAATALVHNFTLVTRNTKHFEQTGVRLIDPFE
jgi:toxin FitB